MNAYKIAITQRAFSDINECVLFVSNVSKEAAKVLYTEIISSINSLKTFPNAYPNIEGLVIGGINIKRMPIHHGRYLIIYKVEGDLITIYDVIDSRKDSSILKV
ncbi:MAG: type II toxin-antitoxin system RelE/ParE family toxin [Bacilli bacterium]|nr:type II toxin-antitoxin system RelE/ParE family toxin [Bacilli bacterium]